jgi:hypothetical protein
MTARRWHPTGFLTLCDDDNCFALPVAISLRPDGGCRIALGALTFVAAANEPAGAFLDRLCATMFGDREPESLSGTD